MIIGMFPIMSMTAKRIIKAVNISLKSSCITEPFKFFAKVAH
jgi:hypothetical protein